MRQLIHLFLELTKPRIVLMVLVTTVWGFYMAGGGLHSGSLLLWTLLGTYCVGSGSSVLNHYMERDVDALMERTKNRPLPQHRLQPRSALFLAIHLILIGLLILYIEVNVVTAFFALLAAFVYNLVYTPVKRLSWWNTMIGSIPGALPPLWGWTAVTGHADFGAWILFLILVAWQHPHFFAIAWMFRDDYRKAGFKMLPVIDPSGQSTFRQILLFSLLLIPISLIPVTLQMAGELYFWGALLLGCLFLGASVKLVANPSDRAARQVLLASVVYLPLLLLLIIGDRIL